MDDSNWNQDCQDISYLRYADDTTLMAESKEEMKSLLMNMGEGTEKAGLKLNIKKTKLVAFNPITSWQIDGETMEMETVVHYIFLGSKITADDDCSHDIERHLLLGRNTMTDLDSVLKSRDITLPTHFGSTVAQMVKNLPAVQETLV